MSNGWTLQGLADLNSQLGLLGNDVARKIGQSADRAGAMVLKAAIVAAAPVGPTEQGAVQTRHGRKVAHSKISESIIVKKTKNVSPTAVQTTIGSGKALQAMFEEFGSIHNAPTRFMSKAVEAAAPDALDAIANVLAKRIAKGK